MNGSTKTETIYLVFFKFYVCITPHGENENEWLPGFHDVTYR